ncbi:MAG: RNA methyltransferase [Bacteroidales bacterium]|nr:RNA methyltransferase [Bacteroidales bacterium]
MRKLKNEELNRISIDEFREIKKNPVIIILDNVRSLNNIGSVFRTADAFLLESIYLCGITATPPHRDITKTALGATDSMNWKYFKTTMEAVKKLKNEGYKLMAVEQTESSILLDQFVPEKENKYALIFGNEVRGVDQHIVNECEGAIEIPQFGTKHSFNISVSAGIVLWDLYQKLWK